MNEVNERAVPPNVRVESYYWSDIYTGSRDALIALGLVTAAQFPGEPGNGKGRVTFYKGEHVTKSSKKLYDENYLQVAREGKKFKVIVGVAKGEQEERRAKFKAQREAEERKAAIARTRAITPAAFIDLAAAQVKRAAILVSSCAETEEFGESPYPYAIPKATWLRVLAKLDEAVEIIESSDVVPRMQPAVACARNDSAFQQFLAAQCIGG